MRSTAPPTGQSRNLVLCCDGTSNQFCDRNTNVVKLFQVLVKDPSRQLCFYDPGVGTFSAPAFFTKIGKAFGRLLGLAFGWGITQNIEDAYSFLMNNWQPGDRIFIFGFSRGAYTARAVAAMIRKVWLLESRSPNLVPYASRIFKHESRPSVAQGFAETFSRRCPIHFLGLWDTVNSVGWIFDPLVLPHTTNNAWVSHVRHAVAIDERRAFFRQHLWGSGQDVTQVWFAGDHCDVGGSHVERESGLSQIALAWMADQAEMQSLLIDPTMRDLVIPRPDTPKPQPAPSGKPEEAEPPDHLGPIHKSLTPPWWLAEFYPKQFRDGRDGWKKKYRPNLFRRRFIPAQPLPLVHESVAMRMRDDPSYRPKNLPRDFAVEPWPRAPRQQRPLVAQPPVPAPHPLHPGTRPAVGA